MAVKPVAMALMAGTEHARRTRVGIYRYAVSRPDWSILDLNGECPHDLIHNLAGLTVAGLLLCPHHLDASQFESIAQFGPVVTEAAEPPAKPVPMVVTSPTSVAELAIQHFQELGLRHFAFVGPPHSELATQQEEALAHVVKQAGSGLSFQERQVSAPLAELLKLEPPDNPVLHKWLRTVPKPVGIVCHDARLGVYLLRTCRRLKLRVPVDVAVLGIGDDPLCEMPDMRLSSVIRDDELEGFEAARLLDRMMEGGPVPSRPIQVPALRVAVRESTKVAEMDPSIARAVAFIRDHAARGINVSDVLQTQNQSRVTFERRFRQAVGRSPGEEIRRVRLELAKEFLRTTNWSINEVARQCGFESGSRFSLFLKQATGLSPSEFRDSARQDVPGSNRG